MAGRGPRGFRTIKEVLAAVLEELGLGEKVVVYRAVTDWPEIVGPQVARHTKALAVEDKTLVVAVDSPAWMTQLFYLKAQLLEKIANRIGSGRIVELRLVLRRR